MGVSNAWAEPWLCRSTAGGKIATKTVGDKLNNGNEWNYTYTTNGGWSTATDIQVYVGTSTTSYTTVNAVYISNDGNTNKNVAANIGSVSFDKSGKWYAVGKYKADGKTAYTTKNSEWTNNTTFSMGSNDEPYWEVTPPAVSNFTVSVSGYLSGTGTSNDPYIVQYGKALTVNLSGSKAKTDANSTLQYNTSGTWNTTTSRTISNITSATKTSVTVKMRCHNSTASLSGTESSKTIYYRSETFTVNISSAGNGTVNPSGNQQVSGSDFTIKATADNGFKFKNWTKTGGVTIANANNANTTITATAAGTVTANFEEDLTSTWHIVGTPSSLFAAEWSSNANNMLKKTTGASAASKGSLIIDVAELPASESSYQFKVLNTNGNKWYGWSKDDNFYWMNKTQTTGVYTGDDNKNNLYFIPNALGEYKFAVDWSGTNPSLTVTFPTAYTVTFGKGTGGSSVTAKYNSTSFNSGTKVQQGKTVTFTQSASTGYTFKEWNTKADGTGTKLSAEATYTHTVTTSNNVYAVYTQNPDRTIYLEPTGFWNSNDPKYVAHVWVGSDNIDIPMTGVGDAPYKYYSCAVPAKYTNIVFYRKSTDGSSIWNQTADLTLPNKSAALYEILSTGEGTSTKATGEWKDAYLFYTVTLGSSMFGPYGISYNGQSYYSHKNEDVIVNVPHGSSINFLEGQPYSDIYSGDIMEKGKVSKFDLTQPYTVLRDVKLESNYVTKESQVAYLGVPNGSTWIVNESYANFTWRFDSYTAGNNGFSMTNRNDKAEFAFEANNVKYYKFTIPAGCNKFQIQRKEPLAGDDESNKGTTYSNTCDHEYMVLNTDINCYMLDGTSSGKLHHGYWCALPPQSGDYRLLYVEQVVEKAANNNTVITRKKAHPSDVVRADEITAEGAIVSLHTYQDRTYPAITVYDEGGNHTYDQGSFSNPEIILQKYDGSNWVDMESYMVYRQLETAHASMATLPGRKNASPGSSVDDFRIGDGIEAIKNDTHDDQGNGVWNFYIINNGTKVTVDLPRTHRYTGDYYIRTNAAFGEWNSYKGSDNHMTRSDVSKHHSNYSHYYCKWVEAVGTNVKFTIANDYGMAISDTLVADSTTLWGDLLANADKIVTGETLPASANVRFSWNEKSNFLHRAYLAGSTDVESRFLVLEGKSNQLYNAEGQALTQGANGSDRYGLKANEEIFNDISNWVYYTDVQMKPGAELKLTAKYNGKVQYFVGQESNYNNTILKGEGDDKYLIRLLYDFKTNELISAYVPGGQTGKEIEAIETNLMLLRKENDTPRQLSFNENNMKDVGKQAYGVLELTQATLEDNTKNVYVRSLYWISFPFDVRITDIFGFGEYGKHWLIQSYDGAKRAREGLWADSETNWVYHFDPNTLNADTPDDDDDGIMKKGVGYVVALNLKNIQADNLFVGRINTLALYFPSTTTITGHIVNTDAVSISVPEHECTINRPTKDGDRRIKDSHWNVIGVPSYINAVGDFSGKKISATSRDLTFYYRWLGDHDKYEPVSQQSLDEEVDFYSLNAYMVQFAGDLKWSNVLNEGPASLAAKRNSDDMKQHHLRLELQQNGQEQDRTFIQLQEDEVTTAFDFNYDLCKIINKGANIYSLIATDRDPIEVAGNVLPVEEAIIPIGIQLDAAGEYTFAMPDGTDGIVAELIDYEANTTTNLLFSDYTVSFPKGTNETRFALSVRPDKTVTSMENITTPSDSEVRKFIIDGVLYMQKDGVLYDAQGRCVK